MEGTPHNRAIPSGKGSARQSTSRALYDQVVCPMTRRFHGYCPTVVAPWAFTILCILFSSAGTSNSYFVTLRVREASRSKPGGSGSISMPIQIPSFLCFSLKSRFTLL
jgi:hypothetical protein